VATIRLSAVSWQGFRSHLLSANTIPAEQTLHHQMIVRRYRSQIVSKSIAPQSLDENAASHFSFQRLGNCCPARFA
jgi:hypothetical protein